MHSDDFNIGGHILNPGGLKLVGRPVLRKNLFTAQTLRNSPC